MKSALLLCGTLITSVACSSAGEQSSTTTSLERDRQFIMAMIDAHPDTEMTGLEMLRLGYGYCTDLVEGATIADLYDRLVLQGHLDDQVYWSVIDVALNTLCPSE